MARKASEEECQAQKLPYQTVWLGCCCPAVACSTISWYYGQWQNNEDKNSLALYAQQFVPQDAQQIKVFLSPTEEVSVNANKASVSYSSHGSVSINNQNYGNAVSDTAGLHMAQTLKEKKSLHTIRLLCQKENLRTFVFQMELLYI